LGNIANITKGKYPVKNPYPQRFLLGISGGRNPMQNTGLPEKWPLK